MAFLAGVSLAVFTAVSVSGLAGSGTVPAGAPAAAPAAGTAQRATTVAVVLRSGQAGTGTGTGGNAAACTAYALQAIRAHVRITGIPAACRGLSPGQVSLAASKAIRMAAGTGTKSAVRRRAGTAEPWVDALLGLGPTAPAPAGGGGALAGRPAAAGGTRIGFSEVAAQVGGLVAWLAAAASGGWALFRWWLATGGLGFLGGLRRLRRGSGTAAPPFVTLGHFGFGLLGLLLWAVFMITGSAPLAWVCVALLGPVAGLGMGALLLGLPSPRGPAGEQSAAAHAVTASRGAVGGSRPTAAALMSSDGAVRGGTAVLGARADPLPSVPSRRPGGGPPVAVIAAHGAFATATLMFVILAAIGAG